MRFRRFNHGRLCGRLGLPVVMGFVAIFLIPGLSQGGAPDGHEGAANATEAAPVDHAPGKACCAKDAKVEAQDTLQATRSKVMSLPDPVLVDHNGREVNFYRDLVQDKVVALNFIFTTCTTICPPLTANFSAMQTLAEGRTGKDFHMISISVDPVTDTPERLKAWGQKFGAEDGWTFLTGSKHDVDSILKALGVFTPLKEDHSPIVLIGDDGASEWTRVNGLAPPATILKEVDGIVATAAAREASASAVNEGALEYFTDVELVNQFGQPMRLYTDLMEDKIVVINCFFTSCISVCPAMSRNFLEVQHALGDRVGSEVVLISISVDPEYDTPPRMMEFAENSYAEDGWYFLSGKPENVRAALGKFGLSTDDRENHSNLVLIGNDHTGLWKKAFGLAPAKDILSVVESVLNDSGA